jgi:hypothetical protein
MKTVDNIQMQASYWLNEIKNLKWRVHFAYTELSAAVGIVMTSSKIDLFW